jgi:L-ascorbate metabolism protein UlaG (beta-lactamase superfamily)
MKLRQIRNATLRLEYAGTRFLIDPWFAEKGSQPGFEGTLNSHLRNPTAELVVPVAELVDVDAVILTHVHPDHWDDVAADALDKDIPFFVQHFGDKATIEAAGFTNVHALIGNPTFEGIKLTRTPGQHGSDDCLQAAYDILGEVCGVLFRHPEEKSLYLAGDTVYNHHVAATLAIHVPDVVVMNCCDAQVVGLGSIIMNASDVQSVYDAAPQATLIASHMEAVNHAALTRAELRTFVQENHMNDRIIIPADGETLSL